MRKLLSFLLLLTATQPSVAEEEPLTTDAKLQSLRMIAEPLTATLNDLAKLETQLEAADTDYSKEEITAQLLKQKAEFEKLREDFQRTLGGSEAAEYDEIEVNQGFQEQLGELIQPLLGAVRDATSEPRELEELRQKLAIAKEREKQAEIVLKRIADLTVKSKDAVMIGELEAAKRLWETHRTRAMSQNAVSQVQINERTSDKRTFLERLSSGFASFFKSRGMNLLIAILAAVFGYIGTLKTYQLIRKISPAHKKGQQNFTSRISDVLALFASILVSLIGVISVFYIRGDWLLLTLIIIFLVGLAWAGKTAIPPYLNQIRMILNLGSVREGERVVFRDIPWKVSKLGFFTTFTNPSLHGGLLRVPIAEIMEMISRPITNRELWFPTEIDDWTLLSDETFGKVINQTPEQVVILRLGGSTKTYPTNDFLSLSPENLSHGFRVSVTFGIDYSYQKDCTISIPQIFQDGLNSALISEYGRENLKSIKVEFSSASASSLDYKMLADFSGEMASNFNAVQRKIQSISVDICNTNGWSIPFTQITIHQAEES